MTGPLVRIAGLLELQGGVFNRRQANEHGVTDNDLRRLIRRRVIVRVHPAVYVTHTGRLSWLERAWAATLVVEPAALWLESALRAVEGPRRLVDDDRQPIQVAVAHDRRPVPPEGVDLHRVVRIDEEVRWNTSPPRQRTEYAAIMLAAGAGRDVDAVAVIADVVGARRTTADRLATALSARPRIPRRAFLRSVIDDARTGSCSALEHGYLTRIERPHGLPRGRRQVQVRSGGRVMYRDVEYGPPDVTRPQLVELDGRFGHESARERARDMERDLDAAVETALDGRATIRLGYQQVFGDPCRTATKIARLLCARGWSGRPTGCPACT